MATDILTTLEFNRVRENLQRHCQLSLTVERAGELGPSSDASTVRYLLDVTSEAYLLIEDAPPFEQEEIDLRHASCGDGHYRRKQFSV